MFRDHPHVRQALNTLTEMGLQPEFEPGRKQLISLGNGGRIHLRRRRPGAPLGWENASFDPEQSNFLMLVMGDDVWIIPAARVMDSLKSRASETPDRGLA